MKKKLLLAILFLVAAAYGWYRWQLRPVNGDDAVRKQVVIERGTSVSGIGALLEEKGLVRSSFAFSVYARLHRAQGDLQAGSFYLQASMGVPEIVQALKRGFAEELTLTVPEGFTIKNIDALVAEKGLAAPGAVLACAKTCDFSAHTFLPPASSRLAARGGRLEGYLFPDTYFVLRDGFEPKAFLNRMLDAFDEKVVQGLSADLTASGKPLADIVTMASLVEEETRTAAERSVVAGILWKRLDIGMKLDVDAAVRYALDKPVADITRTDLHSDSLYNLRKVGGLPPGPIASPGLPSIRAALHPEASSALFYLHGDDGVIRYADTNDEHNANRAKYLK